MEMIILACVLYIGTYKNNKFNSDNWKLALQWLANNCNNITIHTTLDSKELGKDMLGHFKTEEEKLEGTDYFRLRIWFVNNKILSYLDELKFSIDFGVSYIDFLHDNSYIAELEVVDYENFLVLNILDKQERDLVEILPNIQENVSACFNHMGDIESITGKNIWHPLGFHKI